MRLPFIGGILAVLFVPPIDTAHPEAECAYPVCFIEGTLHFPRPHEVWIAGGAEAATDIVTFQVSLTDSLVTMIGLTILLSLVRPGQPGPGAGARVPAELRGVPTILGAFGRSMGGARAARYVPLFASFFVLILTFNWSGLLPGFGIIPGLRAPTSDLNVTAGLALVAFSVFHLEGFRRLGGRGYLSKFFPLYEFRNGVGAGLIAMFVGLSIFSGSRPVTPDATLWHIFGAGGSQPKRPSRGLHPDGPYGLEMVLTVQALTAPDPHVHLALKGHHHEATQAEAMPN
jgi:hypothetical protein